MIKSSVHHSGRPDRMPVLLSGLLFGLLFLSFHAKGQLSGSYSVCSGSCSYSSISAAVSDLATKGISGAVTFNVASGTYTENVAIPAIKGVSAKNTITFKGAGRGKTILQNNNGTTVLYLDSTSYISFDGFTIQNKSATGMTINCLASDYCKILNSNIQSPTGVTANVNTGATNADYFTVSNCHVYGGYYGINISGTAGSSSSPLGHFTISNNRIVEFGNYGINVNNSSGYGVAGNTYSGNVFDSAYSTTGFCIASLFESGCVFKNNQCLATTEYACYFDYPNYYDSTLPYQVYNNFVQGYTIYGMYIYSATSGSDISIAQNTIYADSSSAAYACMNVFDDQYNNGIDVKSNILEELASSNNGANGALILGGNASGFGTVNGNDVYCPGQTAANIFGTGCSDYATYQKTMGSYNWERNANNIKPTYVKPPFNLHLDPFSTAPVGVYAGVDNDIDGDARCKLFPTSGADESSYGKAKATVKFYWPSTVYPGSPTTVFQSGKAGDPRQYHWYLNGVKISDSVTLVTSKFVVGANTLKLVTIFCTGSDSFTSTDTVKAPTSTPVVDFISNMNKIKTGDIVNFQDISSNGPISWQWDITPLYAYVGGIKTSDYTYVNNTTSTSQNPNIQFLVPGKYKVCLTATNSVGKGKQLCKTDYIAVFPSVNLGSASSDHDSAGFIYDNGGPNAPYNSNGGTQTLLLDPCADSVYLVFTSFDVYCGQGNVKLFEGRNASGKLLGKCTGGFTGGKTFSSCSSSCMPDVVTPDTFKAKNYMFIQMTDNFNAGAAGFSAYWWTKPKVSKKPSVSFYSSNPGDSVCTSHSLTFINTTKIDSTDIPTFFWDLDGDLTTFECVGACQSAVEPYFLAGKVKVTLIGTNCGGADTSVRTVTVYYPSAPKADFSVDNTTPTTNEIAFFSADVPVCVDDYKWTITKSSGTGTASFVNGTTDASGNPQVMFSDPGYYDVKLYVDNNSGSKKDSLVKTKYINVRTPYCIPTVTSLLTDIGITHVGFNTIDNNTKPGASEYRNFVNTPSLATTVELGVPYILTVKRDSPVYNTMTRTVYIDWNEDGDFTSDEVIAVDSNSTSLSWKPKITVPKNARLGATVMRIAVNGGNFTNYPCGQNQLGEYQDYRLYVTPYHTLPVITLKGTHGLQDTIYIEQGYQYTEEGYSAYSLKDGDITTNVAVNVKPASGVPYPGAEIYSYDVTDNSGLKALTQYRIIRYVKDTIPPLLEVTGKDTTKYEVYSKVTLPTVFDVFDIVSQNLKVIIDSSTLKRTTVGMYLITYTVSDSAGNTTVVKRYIDIIDTIAPVLTLKGNAVDTMTINTYYKDAGVSTSDNYYKSSTLDSLVKVKSNLDTANYGTYTITYSLTDPSGNKANSVKRTVVVADKTPPNITMKGFQTDSIAVFLTYTDPGVIVYDNHDNPTQITVTKSGTFYTAFPTGATSITGNYTIIYTATDRAGNSAVATRIVKVQDRIAPVITLVGTPLVSVCRWFNYMDDGYTVSDNYDSVFNIKIDTLGTFYKNGGTTIEGIYSIQYQATDKAGNVATSTARAVQVNPYYDPSCANGIAPGLSLEKYISLYPNPNSGLFTVKVNLPGAQNLQMAITDVLGKRIQEINAGTLQEKSFDFDLSTQPKGIYFLTITSASQVYVKKIEISR